MNGQFQHIGNHTEEFDDGWNPDESDDWFEADENQNPGLVLTIILPNGVAVVFDALPVKPEWKEA